MRGEREREGARRVDDEKFLLMAGARSLLAHSCRFKLKFPLSFSPLIFSLAQLSEVKNQIQTHKEEGEGEEEAATEWDCIHTHSNNGWFEN